ncbi:hypothetical protein [uncultured Mailhella sp.]|uniref:hypothetical protein n=1 Tax=uncultured Mailhella sp. TaxID=1981031 RepID=UPI002600BD77|nr:hypothetical protein [uncultured Mailhella sp.]
MEQSAAADIKFVVAIIVEAVVLVWGLVSGVSMLGYILPGLVAVVCLSITVLAIRDFFRQHG